ncbi:MAG: GNAT family N-acetyltransferase [Gallionellaceae bacterium]
MLNLKQLDNHLLPEDIEEFLPRATGEWFRGFYANDPSVEARYLSKRLHAQSGKGILIELRDEDGLLALGELGRLDWDSKHFGIEVYRVISVLVETSLPLSKRKTVFEIMHNAIGDAAKNSGARLLLRRLRSMRMDEVRVLESMGYRLADNVVTMTMNPTLRQATSLPKGATIRKLTIEDVSMARDLMKGSFSLSRFCMEPLLAVRGEAVYEQWLVNAFSDPLHLPNGSVVEYDGQFAGFTLWTRNADLDADIGCSLASLDLFIVGQGWRGKGLGKVLLEETLQVMLKEGAEKVEASTWIAQSAAMATYQKMGFVVRENLLSFYQDLERVA